MRITFFDPLSLQRHQRWVIGASDGQGVAPRGASINQFVIEDANSIGAEFTDCEFRTTLFRNVEFNASRWRRYSPNQCSLGCDFSRTKLTKSMFSQSRFEECRFDGAILKREGFARHTLPGAIFRRADTAWADFSDSDLRESDIAGMSFDYTKFRRCGITGVRGVPANLRGAILTAFDDSPEFDGSSIVDEETVRGDGSGTRDRLQNRTINVHGST